MQISGREVLGPFSEKGGARWVVVTPGWGEIEGGGSTPDEASWLAVAELPPAVPALQVYGPDETTPLVSPVCPQKGNFARGVLKTFNLLS